MIRRIAAVSKWAFNLQLLSHVSVFSVIAACHYSCFLRPLIVIENRQIHIHYICARQHGTQPLSTAGSE